MKLEIHNVLNKYNCLNLFIKNNIDYYCLYEYGLITPFYPGNIKRTYL